ncbi:MAG TPA: MFS transporter, partial [Thermohalobaculum sp.]|nr:MFS transporter [Thermohalobaculum sp.]
AAALIGPEIVIRFQDWLAPVPYAGAYVAVAILALGGAVPLAFLDIPRPPRAEAGGPAGRTWTRIMADRRVPVAMLCAMVAYALMNLVMTSTPLAMDHSGFPTGHAAEVVRIHVLAMYAPSFVTGALIARFGAERVIASGLVLIAVAGGVALSGVQFGHFAVALTLIGVGWNFGFIGATTLLAASHRPEERARVQGLNDFLVFGLVSAGSFSSGALMAVSGWAAVNLAALPLLTLAAVALAWLAVSRRGRSA